MIKQAIDMLGLKVRDKITAVEGIATSVCFDLFGCVQISIDRGMDEKGARLDSYWYDVARLEILPVPRVMPVPSFESAIPATPTTYEHGPADKPAPRR